MSVEAQPEQDLLLLAKFLVKVLLLTTFFVV